MCGVAVFVLQAESIIESQYWCNEAASLFPKVRAAADAAVAALMPAPPASAAAEEEGQAEGEEAPDKKKEDPAEYAAKVRIGGGCMGRQGGDLWQGKGVTCGQGRGECMGRQGGGLRSV